jgi:hypothetical protein
MLSLYVVYAVCLSSMPPRHSLRLQRCCFAQVVLRGKDLQFWVCALVCCAHVNGVCVTFSSTFSVCCKPATPSDLLRRLGSTAASLLRRSSSLSRRSSCKAPSCSMASHRSWLRSHKECLKPSRCVCSLRQCTLPVRVDDVLDVPPRVGVRQPTACLLPVVRLGLSCISCLEDQCLLLTCFTLCYQSATNLQGVNAETTTKRHTYWPCWFCKAVFESCCYVRHVSQANSSSNRSVVTDGRQDSTSNTHRFPGLGGLLGARTCIQPL